MEYVPANSGPISSSHVDPGLVKIKELILAPPDRYDLSGSSKPKIRSLIIMDPSYTWEVVAAGELNSDEVVESAGPSLYSWSNQKTVSCWGIIMVLVLIAVVANVTGVLYIVLGGGSNETFVSRFQAFTINLVDQIFISTYAQQAQSQGQLFEVQRNQMLCLAQLQCMRFNDAYFSHFGVSIDCNYEEVIFDTICPVPIGMFTPFTFIGPNHTISGGDVRAEFNRRSSSSANFANIAASLNARGSPESYVAQHHEHHKPIRPAHSGDYNYNDYQDNN